MKLFAQTEIESTSDHLAPWETEAARELLARLRTPTNFPCFFSQNACRRGRILFAFVEALDGDALAEGARVLERDDFNIVHILSFRGSWRTPEG